ncbi:hypothetical protein CEE45_05800 [Candidatus Heimdallarchaeota archaeon B3_Heim]|nr:MAG: hypothetical protein CEE45_05800 [Candidatus Heimdallarchaeota archaeon B3_Heim]
MAAKNPVVIVDEDNIRSNFISELKLNYRMRLKAISEDPHGILEIDKELLNKVITNPIPIRHIVPSTVNDDLKVDAFFKTYRKSFVIEFKAPYLYQRRTSDNPCITAEMKWRQIHYMQVISKLTTAIGANVHVETGYYAIPYPDLQLPRAAKYDENSKKELLDPSRDSMGINKGEVCNHLFYCPSRQIRLISPCSHHPRHHRGTKKARDTLWGRRIANWVFKYNISDVRANSRIVPAHPPDCNQLVIGIYECLPFQNFFEQIFTLPNPGSPFTIISVFLLNKLVEAKGDMKKVSIEYKKLEKRLSQNTTVRKNLTWLNKESLEKFLIKICPMEADLKPLNKWLKSSNLILIPEFVNKDQKISQKTLCNSSYRLESK